MSLETAPQNAGSEENETNEVLSRDAAGEYSAQTDPYLERHAKQVQECLESLEPFVNELRRQGFAPTVIQDAMDRIDHNLAQAA